MKKRHRKVLIVYPAPAPYWNALFNRLMEQSSAAIDVAYGFVGMRGAAWGEWGVRPNCRTLYLDAGWSGSILGGLAASLRLARLILTGKYFSVIFHGVLIPQGVIGIFLCILLGIPFYLRTDTNSADPRGRFKRLRNRLLLPWLVRFCTGIITTGTRNLQFWQQFGLTKKKTFFTPYAVDDDWWREQADTLTPQGDSIRRRLDFQDKVVFLTAARISPEKGLDHLVFAANHLAGSCPKLLVIMVGTGPEEKRLSSLVKSGNVRFVGFKSPQETARYYAASDVFVLPSLFEPWAMVVNEAMFFRLPIVCASAVGAAADLVYEGRNGLLIKPGSTSSLMAAMEKIYSDRSLRVRMGKESRRIIEEWDGLNRSALEMLSVCLK